MGFWNKKVGKREVGTIPPAPGRAAPRILMIRVLIAAIILASAGVLMDVSSARAAEPVDCRQQTEPGVAPCLAQIAESMKNPSVCHSMANGQAPGEYLRCYQPMVLCGAMTKAQAQAQADADAKAGVRNAIAHGYCR